jgi:hypothetical protein
MYRRKFLPLLMAVAVSAAPAVAAPVAPSWVEQGPGPIFNGQVAGLRGNPVAGAINAIVADPRDADRLLLGTVNGGIWATANATSANPLWTPLTDRLPALSIRSLAMSPADPKLVFGGTGSTSSYADAGSPGFGVLRSTDGGATWQVLAGATFAGTVIHSMVPTSLGGGAVVLAATRTFPHGGVFRSANATAANPHAVTFARVSGLPGSGLPDGGVSALIPDPSNSQRFYAGLSAADSRGGGVGVYRSDDGGKTWAAANGSAPKPLRGLDFSLRILLAIHADAAANAVYAAVIARNGTLTGVFRSADRGANWTSLGVPAPPIYPVAQGVIHGALVADRADPNVAFIAGDEQAKPFPNANGCTNHVANMFRVDAAQAPANRWQNAVCDGANGTAPHSDSRAMAFDANGDLLQANDGGIYRLLAPNQAGRRWVSVIGDIRPTEFDSVAYDPLSKVIIGGAQDVGTAFQLAPGSLAWNELAAGDGEVVAVDADQLSHPGTTLRYSSFQNLGSFVRTTWNAANRFLGLRLVGLNVVSGSCAGRTLTACDPNVQFTNPFVLGASDPSRMLIGTNALYESLDRGDTLRDLTGDTGAAISGLVYGGQRAGHNFAGVIYAGDGSAILHRINPGGTIIRLKYPGGLVRALAVDPLDYRQIVVVDDQSRIWLSANEGNSWANLTGNLPALTDQVQSVAFTSPDGTLAHAALIAGGFGIFELRGPGSGTEWTRLGAGLPNALVLDLHYDSGNDQLLAGSLGRGAWTLTGYFRGLTGPVAANRIALAAPPAPYNLGLPPTPPLATPRLGAP